MHFSKSPFRDEFQSQQQWLSTLNSIVALFNSANKGNVLLCRHGKELGIFKDGKILISELDGDGFFRLFRKEVYDIRDEVGDGSKRLLVYLKRFCDLFWRELMITPVYELESRIKKERDSFFTMLENQRWDKRITGSSLLEEAVLCAGKYGNVVVEDGLGVEDSWELKDLGFEEQDFVLLHGDQGSYDGVLVGLFLDPLLTIEDVQNCMEEATKFQGFTLLLLTPFLDKDLKKLFHINKSIVNVIVGRIKGGRTETFLRDFEAFTRGQIQDRKKGDLGNSFTSDKFGVLKNLTISSKGALFLGYEDDEEVQEKIQKHCSFLKRRREEAFSSFEKDEISKRLSQLTQSLVVYRCGGITETERKNRREKIEKDLLQIRNRIKGGVAVEDFEIDILGSRFLFERGESRVVLSAIFRRVFSLLEIFIKLGGSLQGR